MKFLPKERWACRGKETDIYECNIVRINLSHFEVWRWSQCHREDGSDAFNLDFLGRWRPAETMPDIEERPAQ